MTAQGARRRPRSVLVGLGETAGYCSQLVDGLRAIGVRADHVDLGPDRYAYGEGRQRRLVQLVRSLARRRAAGPGPRFVWRAAHRVSMLILFLDALVRYDAFVLRAGDSFFALRELPLYRRLGKRLVVVFLGTDSRPTYMSGAQVARGISGTEAARSTAAKRAQVRRIERAATAIICHVLTAQLHVRPAVAFLEVGIPRRVPARPESPEPEPAGRPVRILHAPSNVAGKGTRAVREAVERVREQGIDVDLRVITGRPNRDVLEAIGECDFVVDALCSDTPMAGFAAEAAARGRPAVVGGYGWAELTRLTRPEAIPPTHLCHPDAIADAIARLATDHGYRLELGERARRFVTERWAPPSVAERMLAVLDGSASEQWLFDPLEPEYVHGEGIAEDDLRVSVGAVLAASGVEGLGLADKPVLERRLVELAERSA